MSVRLSAKFFAVAAVWLLYLTGDVSAQQFVDTTPRFAADSAAARAMSGNSSVGNGYLVGGWPYGYSVRLAGQNQSYPFSAYGNPRQYGAHDHGLQHSRHPDQARYNQFGRNHWVVRPIWPCPTPFPPVCHPYRPICFPYPNGFWNPYCFPGYARPPFYCWNDWRWSQWHGGFGGFGFGGVGFGGVGFAQQNFVGGWQGVGQFGGQGAFVGQGMGFANGFGVAEPMGVGPLVQSPASLFAPVEMAAPQGFVSSALIQHRAADVMAQHRAIAEMESQRGKPQSQITAVQYDPLGRPIAEQAEAKTTNKDGRAYAATDAAVVESAKSTKNAIAKSADEAREAKRAAKAEAERQRLLDALRQK
ncbi:MAG: hypothetical protein JNL67_13690 [Planctomycetaceae bacterium]|nr:hypothetical protein [Planctomycetaceae bacterium]